jgi:diaminopropionate ammonia-lyase
MPADWLFRNPHAHRDQPYGTAQRTVVSLARLAEVDVALSPCPAHRRTPLHRLPGLAAELGVGAALYKDEAQRFGFGAFKALGGVYAVGRQLQQVVRDRTGTAPDFAALVEGHHRDLLREVTVTAASSGNHGRAVAAGARLFGCRCTILLPSFASAEKEALIRARGAEVVRVAGDYDQSLAECRQLAAMKGWILVSDTSWPGYVDIPRDVMQAYGVIAREILDELQTEPPLTHVLLQAGVGGLATGIAATLWETLGSARPLLAIVEPESADCFMQSARAGRPAPASGDARTMMGGLACREISPDTWAVLQPCIDWFCTVPENAVAPALRRLALPGAGDRPIAAGPSGCAGLQALLRLAGEEAARQAIGLDRNARVLLIGSEGAAGEPAIFSDAVGRDVAAIEMAGANWDRSANAAAP